MTSKIPVRIAEDIDESSLNYAEIKALATGNPLIKEKMDLDLEVNKLTILESNYKSNLYSLEDKIKKFYPENIEKTKNDIEKIKKDLELLEKEEVEFSSIRILGKYITEKKEAGNELLKSIKNLKFNNEVTTIGSYKGFKISTYFENYTKEYKCILHNNYNYYTEFGIDPIGNITRINNLLDKIPVIIDEKEKTLQNYYKELENAKEIIKQPFAQEEILKNKRIRLNYINKIIEDSQDSRVNKNFEKNKNLER